VGHPPACGSAIGQTALGGAIILGDIALPSVVLPEILAYEGEELIDAVGHGTTAVGIAGVPGVMLYVDGLTNIAVSCYSN